MVASRLIDASVIIAAYIEGDETCKSLLKSHKELYILDLTMLEVANVFAHRPETTTDTLDALRILQYLKYEPYVIIHPSPEDYENALKLSFATTGTSYDSHYHGIALVSGLIFTTLDKKYYDKAKHLGSIELLA